MKRLDGKIAIVTGAAAGIGETTARLFAAEGAKVVACDISMEPLEEIVKSIKAEGGEAIAVKCDVSQESDVKEMIQTTIQEFGKINILINNAGITRDTLTPRMTVENWDLVMSINLKGTFLCSKYALAKMERGGKVVNTSSIATLGNKGQSNYAASKMGVIGLTRTLALEYSRKKICINAIAPGAVDTPMLRAGLGREHVSGEDIHARLENLAGKTVNGRVGTPEEIAHAIYFLADETKSSFMTGQALIVDGGATARLSTE
jgi:NAD(P)-dependent dehydrogenase (short-subunit alcohol dehydrogenase family)